MCALPASTVSSDGVELGQRHLGQEAEAAEVDAENRDARAGAPRCSRPSRAACRRRRARRPCRPRDERELLGDAVAVGGRHERGGRRFEDRLRCRARAATPRCRSGAASPRAGATWRRCRRARCRRTSHRRYPITKDTTLQSDIQRRTADSQSDFSACLRFCVDRRHLSRRCRKNSWLPVAPVMAEGAIAIRSKPARAAASVTRGDDRLVDRRIGDEPVLADLVASRFELRLHERDDVGVRRRGAAAAAAGCGAAR